MRLQADRELLAREHTYLEYRLDERRLVAVARGAVPLLLPDGQVDAIEIAVDFHPGYPTRPPIVSDAGRRWIPSDDRHIPEDHSFCLYLRDVDEPDLGHPAALQLFMLDVVCFLEQQLICDRIGRFPGPQWPHKRDAYALYIVEQLAGESPVAAANLWDAIRGVPPPRNAPCPCATGTKYKRCTSDSLPSLPESRPDTTCAAPTTQHSGSSPVWRRSKPPATEPPRPGIEFGWRVHLALQEWTKSVDQKASIILVFSAALGTLAGREVFDVDGGFHAASGAKLWVVRLMGASFATSALLAISVVLPRLRRRVAKREAEGGLVYFGHLRHRSTAHIERDLRRLDDDEALAQLARQLKATSVIAWRKHARLQISMHALLLAAATFALARLFL